MGLHVALAFDKSARSYDVDNRLHLAVTNISKAAINPYFGKEIPNYQALGLDANTVYKLFRDPKELEKAAPTFNNLPLLSKHVPVSANDHQPDLVIGSTGSDAEFAFPYLKTSLVVWAQDAIDGIENETKKELSSAYRYKALMEPGEYKGEKYDGIMTDIIGNHVALVEAGRAGSDVVVGDSKPHEDLLMKFTKLLFNTRVKPLLAQDSALTYEKFITLAKKGLDSVKAHFAMDSVNDEMKSLVAAASIAEVSAFDSIMMALDDLEPEDREKVKEKLKVAEDEDDDEEDKKKKEAAAKKAEDEEDKKDVKTAMDAAIKKAGLVAEANAMKRFTAIRQAEKDVLPLVGEVVAMDSAEEIYKFALDSAQVDITDVHPSAYSAMVKLLINSKTVSANPKVAMDAASASNDFATMFPNAKIPKRAF